VVQNRTSDPPQSNIGQRVTVEISSNPVRIGQFLTTVLLFVGLASVPFDFVVQVGVARLTPTELFLTAAILLWGIGLLLRRRQIEFSSYLAPMIVFLITVCLSVMNAHSASLTLREVLQYGWLFVLFFFLRDVLRPLDTTFATWHLLVAIAVIVSLVGMLQYFTGSGPTHFLVAQTRARAHGFFDQPNTLGIYLCGIVPIIVGMYLVRGSLPSELERLNLRGITRLAFVLVLFGIVFLAFVLTYSRGSWLGLFVGMCLFGNLLIHKHLGKRLLIPGVIVMIVSGSIAFDFVRQPEQINRSNSDRLRVLILSAAGSMIQDHPITGIGAGNFKEVLPEYASEELISTAKRDYNPLTKEWYFNPNKKLDIELVHNLFLQILTESGALGLLAFVWILVVFYRDAFKCIRHEQSQQVYIVRAAMLAAVTAILAAGMTGWPFSHGNQELLMYSMAVATTIVRSA
jgi:putative inorganic carbon (HCO3(-)) transporter